MLSARRQHGEPDMGSAEDVEAIRQLLATYCFCTDSRRPDLLCQILTPDFVFSGVAGNRTGHAQMHAMYEDNPRAPSDLHLNQNVIIDVQGDEAGAFSYMYVIRKGESIGPVFAGAIRDSFVRQDGRWFFKTRHILGGPWEFAEEVLALRAR